MNSAVVLTFTSLSMRVALAMYTLYNAYHSVYSHALTGFIAYWFLCDFVIPTAIAIQKWVQFRNMIAKGLSVDSALLSAPTTIN